MFRNDSYLSRLNSTKTMNLAMLLNFVTWRDSQTAKVNPKLRIIFLK